jgi:hypothetical protein
VQRALDGERGRAEVVPVHRARGERVGGSELRLEPLVLEEDPREARTRVERAQQQVALLEQVRRRHAQVERPALEPELRRGAVELVRHEGAEDVARADEERVVAVRGALPVLQLAADDAAAGRRRDRAQGERARDEGREGDGDARQRRARRGRGALRGHRGGWCVGTRVGIGLAHGRNRRNG